MGLTLKQYVQHIIQLGGGLPLDAIRQNKAKELDFYNRDLTNAEVREIANVLISNRSLKTMELNWENLSDENKIVFLTTKHKCIVDRKMFLLSSCENGNLNMVQAFIENKTTIQLNAKENDEDNSALYTLGFSYATMNQNNSNDHDNNDVDEYGTSINNKLPFKFWSNWNLHLSMFQVIMEWSNGTCKWNEVKHLYNTLELVLVHLSIFREDIWRAVH